eukprot:TRINITY_DN103751_c0_g1_i1.p1 TRINITY_DN103751_c0_g1~~TRINITY_DN103751_c0_g1_i1.p1  ORF type:complete len:333 (+),score=39.76 TRINITY_DN103751_c0_g1_i1:56-1054(+)
MDPPGVYSELKQLDSRVTHSDPRTAIDIVLSVLQQLPIEQQWKAIGSAWTTINEGQGDNMPKILQQAQQNVQQPQEGGEMAEDELTERCCVTDTEHDEQATSSSCDLTTTEEMGATAVPHNQVIKVVFEQHTESVGHYSGLFTSGRLAPLRVEVAAVDNVKVDDTVLFVISLPTERLQGNWNPDTLDALQCDNVYVVIIRYGPNVQVQPAAYQDLKGNKVKMVLALSHYNGDFVNTTTNTRQIDNLLKVLRPAGGWRQIKDWGARCLSIAGIGKKGQEQVESECKECAPKLQSLLSNQMQLLAVQKKMKAQLDELLSRDQNSPQPKKKTKRN